MPISAHGLIKCRSIDAAKKSIKKRSVIIDDPLLRDNEVFYLLCSNTICKLFGVFSKVDLGVVISFGDVTPNQKCDSV